MLQNESAGICHYNMQCSVCERLQGLTCQRGNNKLVSIKIHASITHSKFWTLVQHGLELFHPNIQKLSQLYLEAKRIQLDLQLFVLVFLHPANKLSIERFPRKIAFLSSSGDLGTIPNKCILIRTSISLLC